MNSTTFIALVPWIIAHGYFLFLIAATIEGSLVTTAAGVACALGYYNIFIIILLSVLGDVIGDLVYYFIGYHSRRVLVSPFFKRFGLTDERITKIEGRLHRNTYNTLILIKLSPLIGPPGLILVGASHIPFKKFFKAALVVTLPKCLFFALIGFFAGNAYIELSKKVETHQYVFFLIGGFLLGVYFLYQYFAKRAAKKLE